MDGRKGLPVGGQSFFFDEEGSGRFADLKKQSSSVTIEGEKRDADLLCFLVSLFALSGVRFDRFVNVRQPMKAQVLLLVLAMALAYLCGSFLLELTIYNGL